MGKSSWNQFVDRPCNRPDTTTPTTWCNISVTTFKNKMRISCLSFKLPWLVHKVCKIYHQWYRPRFSLGSSQIQHQANAAQTNPLQLEMFKLIQQMQQSLTTLGTDNNKGGGGKGRCRQQRKTPNDARFHRNQTDMYCWTHGACRHTPFNCNAKAPGHQDSATMDNRLGGSNAFCCEWKIKWVVDNIVNNTCHTSCSSPALKSTNFIIAKGDSGASAHYIWPEDTLILKHIKLAPGSIVHQLDATPLRTTDTGQLPLSSKILNKAQQWFILPHLQSSSLIVIGPICNNGSKIVLSKINSLSIKVTKWFYAEHESVPMIYGTFQ